MKYSSKHKGFSFFYLLFAINRPSFCGKSSDVLPLIAARFGPKRLTIWAKTQNKLGQNDLRFGPKRMMEWGN